VDVRRSGRVPYKLCIEEWSLPDTTRFIKLSIKVKRNDAPRAQRRSTHCSSASKSRSPTAWSKERPRVLKFFGDRLAAGR
jgi:hypothetical protein